MKNFIRHMEKWFAAVAWAEGGEFDTALDSIGSKRSRTVHLKHIRRWFERVSMAVAFAEADCRDTALSIMDHEDQVSRNRRSLNRFMDVVGLKGVSYNYGLIRV